MPIAVTEKSAVAGGKPETRKSVKGAYEPRRTVYYVHPEYRMPEESNEKLDDAVASHVRAWEFKGEETLHPFCAVERLTEDERRKARASGGDSIAITLAVVVPIMTNSVDVKKGEELFLESVNKKDATKRKEESWKTDVAKAEEAPKPKAKAKTAANSLEGPTLI